MPPKEIPDELVDQLLAGREGPEAITGPDGLLKQLTKRVVERAVSAELTGHLGYEFGEEPPLDQSNRRNGLTSKTLITECARSRQTPRICSSEFPRALGFAALFRS